MPLFTLDQVMVHIFGDYFLQSDWMATGKKDKVLPCLFHAVTYVLPFLLLTRSILALLVISGTHFVIDHWGLARYLAWLKNFLGPKSSRRPWKECKLTGFSPDRPIWLVVWLTIIMDNSIHLLINALSIRYL